MWCWSSVCPHGAIVNLLQPASTQCGVGPVCVPIELLSTYFNLPQPSVVLVQCVSPWSYCQPTSTCLNPVWCWSSVCPHRAIVNLLQPASTQCGVGPVCVPIELLSTYFNCLNPVWRWSSVCPHGAIVNLLQPASTQCGVGPVCVPIELLSTYFNCLNPVWRWSSVCPHGAIVNLLQPASTQCGVGPVCVPIELLSTYFNLPQPSVVLVQCVSP